MAEVFMHGSTCIAGARF